MLWTEESSGGPAIGRAAIQHPDGGDAADGSTGLGRHDASSREVLALAVPAFLALVAEPLFLLADSAVVGRLGTVQLAGLGVASAALATAAGVFVFLAYGTTAAVSRRAGSGDLPGALGLGADGVWLAVLLGAATGGVLL